MSATKYRCPRCSQARLWTDGRSAEAGDEVDEYWCQHCGEESLLADCEKVAPFTDSTAHSAWSPDAWELS